MNQYPTGQRGAYTTEPPGRERLIYSGAFLLHEGQKTVHLRGKLLISWFPNPGVRFYGRAIRRERLSIELPQATIEVPQIALTGPVILSERKGLTPAGMYYSGAINGVAIAGIPDPATTITFHLVNFHAFLGNAIRFDTLFTRSRLILHSHGCRVTIDRQPGECEKLHARGGYAITHAGTLTRTGHRPISFRSANEHLQSLHCFLAFCRGAWCGPIISTAWNGTVHVWTQWASWKLTVWNGFQSWFPFNQMEKIAPLYGEFQQKWRTPLWKRTLTGVIHWYVQANAYGDTLESRLVPAFVALEALAWVYVVEHKKLETAGTFDDRRKMNAAKRIARLLGELKIPIRIPVEHQRLRRVARTKRATSGPEIIAKIRNSLVHPQRKGKLSKHVLFAATSLSLEYLELSILAILSYHGPYVRRIAGTTRSAATVLVPWA